MRKSLIISHREISAMLKERSFLLMILLELLLVSSSGLLSVGYVLMTSPESSSTLTQLSSLVYVGVVSDTPEGFSKAFDAGGVHYTYYSSFPVAYRDFTDGLTDAVVVGDLTEDSKPSVVKVFVPSNSPKAPITKLALKRVFLGLEDSIRLQKVEEYAPRLQYATYRIMNFKPQARHAEIYFIFTLPLLLFLPCVVSGSLAIDGITQDLESKRMINLAAAPLTYAQIVFGKSFGSFLLAISQSALWLAVMSATFISPQNHLTLLIICALYAAIFMNAGTIIALYVKRMKNSQILYTFISMSAISLFSPLANTHPLLLANSPSYLITATALGTPATTIMPQLATLIILAAATSAAVYRLSWKVNEA
ncbi:MAG: ABC transporter permease [Candidatus Altiarchaeota archaeon]